MQDGNTLFETHVTRTSQDHASIHLDSCGWEVCAHGLTADPGIRSDYLLYLIRSGSGCLKKKDKTFFIRAKHAFLVYPGEEITFLADREEPWNGMWVAFHGQQAGNLLRQAGFSPDEPVRQCTKMNEAVSILKDLFLSEEPFYTNEILQTGYLYQILSLLISRPENPLSRTGKAEISNNSYVSKAIHLLTHSGQQHVTITSIAKTIGISRSYLTNIFKKETNASPQEFLMNFRMEKARTMLSSSETSVSMIAESLGYADVLSFSKSFHRHFGISPTQYRINQASKRPERK